jgi:hypothetical protein
MTDVTAQAFREAAAAIFTNDVIRAIGALARQQNVCREQDGKAVFVTGMEAAREYIIEHVELAAAEQREQLDKKQWTLDNIYTIARRHAQGKHDTQGRWGHILRLCEAVGCQPRGVLKDNGGSMEGPSDE